MEYSFGISGQRYVSRDRIVIIKFKLDDSLITVFIIKSNKTMNHICLLLFLFFINCSSDSGTQSPDMQPDKNENTEGSINVKYSIDDSDFPNPERGFYRYSETKASNYSILDENELKAFRSPSTSQGANYKTINTVIFRYYILDDFVYSPISKTFLDNIQQDFDAARNAGVKLIPRFTYTVRSNSGDCSEGFICPPYGDATKEIILEHIGQLGPVLTNNADVVLCLQLGFIGTWGENYYTDYFGDASSNGDQGKLIDKNWQDRIEILKALLDATPKDIMIQVRYPQFKQRFIYGIDANTKVAALTDAEAFTGSDKARIAFHNDCLFASEDDYGTYEDYGNSSSPRRTDIKYLKPYFKEDSKYVIVGGETCSDGFSPENDCAPAGLADTELRELHYTFLNSDYNNDVNNDWTDGGCIEPIKRNLGYRFVLLNAVFPNKIETGKELMVVLKLENLGYASPVKSKNVKLILRNKKDSSIISFQFITDIRFWFDKVTLMGNFATDNLIPGEYELLLQIEDEYESLKNRPEYSIRLANKETWEATTGYNKLNHILILL